MAKQKVYILSFNEWFGKKTERVYNDIEKARKVMKREVKAHLKKLPDWEIDYQKENEACIHCESRFFDRNTTWHIKEGTMAS